MILLGMKLTHLITYFKISLGEKARRFSNLTSRRTATRQPPETMVSEQGHRALFIGVLLTIIAMMKQRKEEQRMEVYDWSLHHNTRVHGGRRCIKRDSRGSCYWEPVWVHSVLGHEQTFIHLLNLLIVLVAPIPFPPR